VTAARAPWTSASFLLYTGGLAILLAIGALFGVLGGQYSDAGFAGWSALIVALLGVFAFAARGAGQPLTGGLFAASGVVSLAVFAGAAEEWFGWLAHTGSAFGGFHVSHFAIELTLVVGAAVALRLFRFPFLVLIGAASTWFLVTDLVSNGGTWSATVSLLFGIAGLIAGSAADRVYGFWIHVVAGLTIGGALLEFWHKSDTDWILVALVSVAFVLIAARLERSSYAVLAAIGLFLTTTHFVFKWFLTLDFSFFGEEPQAKQHPSAAVLSYALYGLVLMLIALWLAHRRGAAEPA
jgi:hypothetical protein